MAASNAAPLVARGLQLKRVDGLGLLRALAGRLTCRKKVREHETIFSSGCRFLLFTASGFAQMEGPVNTQMLVQVDSKAEQIPALADVTMKVNGKEEPLTGWSQVPPNGVQIALLIDDGPSRICRP